MKAIPNPEYDELRNYLCVGYQQMGPSLIMALVNKNAIATPEQVAESWKAFDEHMKNYDPYKNINAGPIQLTIK